MKKQIKKSPRQSPAKKIAVFGLGLIPKEGVPEIKIQYNRTSKVFLGKVTSSRDAANFIRKAFPTGSIELQESVIILYLNRANEILGYYRHTIGGISGTLMDVRLIYATALASASVGLILSHNHPSGNLTPSQADIDITRRIKEAGKILDIQLLDHLIITKNSYFSFADEGKL